MALIAEASCASQILTARAVAEDMGEVQAARKGVKSWASCHLQNSERDVQRTMKNQKTKLDIPVKTIECNGVQVPWISPESWLQWIVKKGLWPTLAGCSPNDYQGAPATGHNFGRTTRKWILTLSFSASPTLTFLELQLSLCMEMRAAH